MRELVVGNKYYTCAIDVYKTVPEPVIETFVYLGYFELDHNSTSCDKPYHFYRFAYYGQDDTGVNVPSLRTVQRGYLSFPELLTAISDMVVEIQELMQKENLKRTVTEPNTEELQE